MKVRELIEQLTALGEDCMDKEINSFIALYRADLNDINHYLDEDETDYGVLCGETNSVFYSEETDTVEIGNLDVDTNSFYSVDESEVDISDRDICECEIYLEYTCPPTEE